MRSRTFMRPFRMEAGRRCCGRRFLWPTIMHITWGNWYWCGGYWATGRRSRGATTQSLDLGAIGDAHGNRLHNLCVNLIEREVALDADDAMRVAAGDLSIFVPD